MLCFVCFVYLLYWTYKTVDFDSPRFAISASAKLLSYLSPFSSASLSSISKQDAAVPLLMVCHFSVLHFASSHPTKSNLFINVHY